MANTLRGEVAFKAGDKDHVLRLSVASCLLLEQAFEGASLPRIVQERFSDATNVRVSDVVTVLWAALQSKGQGPSREEVVALADEAGLAACLAVIGELFAATFQTADAADAGNPPQASRGSTGAA